MLISRLPLKKYRLSVAVAAAAVAVLVVLLAATLLLLYALGVIPHKTYDAEHFGIDTYRSATDRDGDGIDDQTDILRGARAYVDTRPRYESRYYSATGWPDDGYGVCTDVVARALLAAGYDLRALMAADIAAHPERYGADVGDDKIDFRRVRNQHPYFEANAIRLTTDPHDIAAWQGGDIVVFPGHVGIVSDRRNARGVPYIIHHGSPDQRRYEEDILEYFGEILGHYRMS